MHLEAKRNRKFTIEFSLEQRAPVGRTGWEEHVLISQAECFKKRDLAWAWQVEFNPLPPSTSAVAYLPRSQKFIFVTYSSVKMIRLPFPPHPEILLRDMDLPERRDVARGERKSEQ